MQVQGFIIRLYTAIAGLNMTSRIRGGGEEAFLIALALFFLRKRRPEWLQSDVQGCLCCRLCTDLQYKKVKSEIVLQGKLMYNNGGRDAL